MPRTMETAPAFRQAVMILLLILRKLAASFVEDLVEICRHRVYVPTRQEMLMFVLMFSLGANLVTILAIASAVARA